MTVQTPANQRQRPQRRRQPLTICRPLSSECHAALPRCYVPRAPGCPALVGPLHQHRQPSTALSTTSQLRTTWRPVWLQQRTRHNMTSCQYRRQRAISRGLCLPNIATTISLLSLVLSHTRSAQWSEFEQLVVGNHRTARSRLMVDFNQITGKLNFIEISPSLSIRRRIVYNTHIEQQMNMSRASVSYVRDVKLFHRLCYGWSLANMLMNLISPETIDGPHFCRRLYMIIDLPISLWSAWLRKMPKKTCFVCSRSFKVVMFGTNRIIVCDLLVVVHTGSYMGRISHGFGATTLIGQKVTSGTCVI